MFRAAFTIGMLAVLGSTAPAFADNKSDCVRGVAMIKAQLKKKHPPEVRDQLKKALDQAEGEVLENDWSECVDYINTAKKALAKK